MANGFFVTISNSGASASRDNAGDEFTDVLPAQLALVNAVASAGTASANVPANTVTWNGSVPAGGSVTITITATILPGNGGTQRILDQLPYADLNGTNETTVTTDDPSAGGANDPTSFVIAAEPAISEIPTVSEIGLMALILSLMAAAWMQLRRRQMIG